MSYIGDIFSRSQAMGNILQQEFMNSIRIRQQSAEVAIQTDQHMNQVAETLAQDTIERTALAIQQTSTMIHKGMFVNTTA